MIVVIVIVLGLCLGSFTNALVWRVHEQAAQRSKKKPDKKYQQQLSIAHGRSMCPECHHELATKDLVPVLSWLSLKGKCRYCGKAISWQYPLVELAMAGLFVASYLFWPAALGGSVLRCPQPYLFHGVSWQHDVLFIVWLTLLVGLVALLVYDLRWMLLPNKIIYPLAGAAAVYAVISIFVAAEPLRALLDTLAAVAVGGGIFYLLFQVSQGKWIGGGDVKLGWLLGLIVGTPARSLLLIFMAAVFGSLMSLPLLATNRLRRTSTIPFGPFLIIAAIIVQLFGASILHWYQQTFIGF